jgi:predicted ATPase
VRDQHAAILRQAIRDGDGVEVSTEGDSFFAAFASPVAAVRAAVAAQRGLAGHGWPTGFPVPVRMGLHTGEGTLGGDLGIHRLRDLNLPMRLYDLVVEGLPADFPAPRTLDARPGNLPAQLTSFVGREAVSAEVVRLLDRARLVTLTGAGGAGKSRLALHVAEELRTGFRDGAFFADLSTVTDPGLVPPVLARALGVPESGRPVLEAVCDHLRDRQLLLVVDNFEQVAGAGSVIERLLAAAPRIKVLVTSRVTLALRGEQELVVPPLGSEEATALFVERAQAVWPEFRLTTENAPAVAEIAARLDGLPLAIELAATRTKVLTPAQILPRLQQRLTLLTTGARTLPDRQRTLRGAIAWSHDLLTDTERRLFARLSVFAGGWTLESAEAVCDPEALGVDVLDGLTSLVDKSLVRRVEAPGRPPRFSMLETIREFGREQLEACGDLEQVRRRHAEHFLDLAVEAEPHLTGPDQREWLRRCDLEQANLRAALRWAVDAADAGRAQAAAGALWRFWQQRGHLAEGRRWLEEVLAMPSGRAPTAARAKALAGAGGIAWWQEDIAAARRLYEEALAVERELGDPARIADALYNLAFVAGADRDFEGAFRLFEESRELFRLAGDEAGVARADWMLPIRDMVAGRWDAPQAKAAEAVATWRRTGDRFRLGDGLVWLAVVYARAGRPADAHAAMAEARELFGDNDSPIGMLSVLLGQSYLARWEGRYEDAVRLAGAAASLRDQVGGRAPLDFLSGFLGDPEAEARAHLSPDAADRAWRDGRATGADAAG